MRTGRFFLRRFLGAEPLGERVMEARRPLSLRFRLTVGTPGLKLGEDLPLLIEKDILE